MARLRPILSTMVVGSLRRSQSAGKGYGPVILLLVIIPGLWSYFQTSISETAFFLQLAETKRANTLFLEIWSAWLILPLFLKSGGLDRAELTKLLRFPLTWVDLLIISLIDLLVNPFFLVVAALTGLSWAVPAAAPYPDSAKLGFLFFACGSVTTMLIIHDLGLIVSNSFRMQRVLLVLPFVLILLVWLLTMLGLDQPLLAAVLPFLPHKLLLESFVSDNHRAALLLGALALLAACAKIGAFAYLVRVLRRESGQNRNRGRRFKWRPLPKPGTPKAVLIHKNIIDAYHGVEPMLGWLFGLGCLDYLIRDQQVAAEAYWFAITLIVLCHINLAWNAFGHDGPGFARLRTYPLSAQNLMCTKNLAFALIVVLPILPLTLAAAFRFGFAALPCGLLQAANYVLLLLLWGNPVCLRLPAKRNFLSNKRANLPPLGNILFLVLTTLAVLLMGVITWRNGAAVSLIAQSLLFGLLHYIYSRSLPSVGRLFARQANRIEAALGRG